MRGASLRKAVIASIGVHLLLAAGGVLILRRQATDAVPASIGIETRADVRFEFVAEEPSHPLELTPLPEKLEPTPVPEVAAVPNLEPNPEVPAGPPLANAIAIPRTLPPEVMGLVKKSASAPPAAANLVQPIAATQTKPVPAWMTSGTPLHGALDAKQCIVYVLDASGSMGEWGKFDAARGALIATIRLQPESVRFQIVIYSGVVATPIRSAPGECLASTSANVAKAIAALESLGAPSGRSNHVEGLRAALAFRPDLVLILTDADDLPSTAFRGVVKQAAKPAKICTARVQARAVDSPVEVK